MKKFTLILAAALVSLGATAQTVQQRAEIRKALNPKSFSAQQKNIQQSLLVSPDEVKKAKLETAKILKSAPKHDAMIKKAQVATQAAERSVYRTYYTAQPLLDNWGDYALSNMRDGYAVVSSDSVYLLVDNNSTVFSGKRIAENRFTEIYGDEVGIDSIAFSVEGNTWEGTDGKIYNLSLVDINYDQNAGAYNISRLTGKTFGAYYFRDTKEIVCPDLAYALFEGNLSTPVAYTTTAYQYHYCADTLDAATYKAKVSHDYVSSSTGQHIALGSDTARFVFAGSEMYVKGASLANPDAWLRVDYSLSEDQTEVIGAYMQYNQYVGSGQIELNDGTSPFCDIVFFPLLPTGRLTSTLNMFLDVMDDGTVELSSDGTSYYSEIFGSQEFDGVGLYAAIRGEGGTVITISNDLVSGIKGVNAQAAAGNTSVEYFDLQGRKVDASAKGLVVKRVRSANGVVTSTKILK